MLNRWIQLTKPPDHLQTSQDRFKARLFSSVLLVMGLLTLIGTLTLMLVAADKLTGLLGITVIVWLAYGFSRTRHYLSVADAFVWILTIFPFVAFASFQDYSLAGIVDSFVWLPMPVVLSSLVLTVRKTALVAAAGVLGLLLLPLLILEVHYPNGAFVGYVFAINSLIVLVGVVHSYNLSQLEYQLVERKLAEAALRKSEERYRLIADNSEDVIWTADMDFKLTYCSPSVLRARGYTVEEVMQQSLEEMFTPESLQVVHQAFQTAMAMEKNADADAPSHRITEVEYWCKDGSTFWSEVKWAFLRDDTNKPVGILGVGRDVTDRREAQALLQASLVEKEVLLKEIHHRVKNNMQIISSLLNLQSQDLGQPDSDVQAGFRESQDRVRTMALVHEHLYRSDNLAQIQVAQYTRDLVSYLRQSYDSLAENITIRIDADDTLLDVDQAIPCGLIVNELVANAFKHAFPDGRDGKIEIGMATGDDGRYGLSIQDDGVGMNEPIDSQQPTSLGLQLVHSLAHQLNGTVTFEHNGGTMVKVCFAIPGN